MKHCLIVIFIIGITTNLFSQNYRLLITTSQKVVGNEVFMETQDYGITHERDEKGWHRYYVDNIRNKNHAEEVLRFLIDKGFSEAQIIEKMTIKGMPPSFPPPPPAYKNIYIKSVFFDSGKSNISFETRNVLDVVSLILRENPAYTLFVEAHTDAIGDPISNKILSEERARKVRQYLVDTGTESYRLLLYAYGECAPVAINKFGKNLDSPEGRSYNRRVDFKVYNENNEIIFDTAGKDIPLEIRILEEKAPSDSIFARQ